MKLIQSFLVLLTLGLMTAFSTLGPGPELKPGAAAPAFNLKNIDGKMVSLADYSGKKGAIVIFTCNHCPYAVAYEDRIIDLHKKYAKKGYPVVAINPNNGKKTPADSYEKMQERAEEKGFPFVYLYDETQEVAKAYGATRTPHVFLVNNESGKPVIRYVGTIDNNVKEAAAADEHYLADAIDALLAGKQPSESYTKAVGCTIKWLD